MELISLSTFPTTYIKRVNLQPDDLDEDVLMEFTIDAVQRLQTEKTCNHMVSLIPVANYNAPKPADFCRVVEMAYLGDPNWKQGYIQGVYHDEVISWTDKNFAGCDVKITVECDECHQHICECGDNNVVIRVDDEWMRANVERQYWNNPRYVGAYGLNKMGGRGCFYHPEFSLIRPARHKFFGADYHVRGCVNLDKRLLGESPIEYMLENKNVRINAEEGIILMSYLAIPKDEMGFPMVPDDVDVFEAIFWDVESKMLYRNKDKKKNNYRYFQEAKQYGEFHMRRAKEKINSISPAEWSSILRNIFKKLPYRNIDAMAGRVQADRFEGAIRRRRNG